MNSKISSNNTESDLLLSTEKIPDTILSYEPHSSINIYDDDDFNTTADSEGWDGDGSIDDPFIIEGYEIYNDEVLIYISNTRYHFEIRDCNLTDGWRGIEFRNVTNGLIENCLLFDTYTGIYLYNVTGVDVIGCNITPYASTPTYGIYIDTAIDCLISSCLIQGREGDSTYGIYGENLDVITLFNNTIYEFSADGIFAAAFTEVDILNNTVYWNYGLSVGCGMYLLEGNLLEVTGNNVTENTDNGITIDGVTNVSIKENYVVGNDYHGISIRYADVVLIQDNIIEDNGDEFLVAMCGIHVYRSEDVDILGNDMYYNLMTSIAIEESEFCYVFDNFMNYSYDHGIYVSLSPNVTIYKNEIYNSLGLGIGPSCGIYVSSSNDSLIHDNILGDNSENGLSILNSDYGEVIDNTIFNSEYSGIRMVATSHWNVTENVIYDNGAPGIYLESTTDNITLYQNDIGWSGEFLVYDAGEDNDWNCTGIGNWYSDYSGSGTYAITGGASVDSYPSMSLYTGITEDTTIEVGTDSPHWNSSALNPWKYDILVDNDVYSTSDWDGTEIDVDITGLSVGEYNVCLVVYHVSGHWQSNSSSISIEDTQIPTWDVIPSDQVFELGEVVTYDINASDYSGIDHWWLTGDSGFTIDDNGIVTNTTNLVCGEYELTVNVNDTFGHQASADFSIFIDDTVYPVWVTAPTDQTINETDVFSLQLEAYDLAGIGGWQVNDTANFAISTTGLITNASVLAPGDYGLNITVWDSNQNAVSRTIKIHVTAVEPSSTTTTTTTSTETDTGTTTPPPDDGTTMILVITAGGLTIIVVIGIIGYKVKKGY